MLGKGFEELFKEYVQEGLEQGIKALIEDKLEDGASRDLIKERIIKRFQLSDETAEGYINKYAKVS